jgi:phosphoenolpyruvate-protein phosphotransferase (PTS system enzyme I)
MPKKGQIEVRLRGLPLSGGCAVARVCMFSEDRHRNLPLYRVPGGGVDWEVARVKEAISIAAARLDQIRDKVEREVGKAEAGIFAAQKMIVEDSSLLDRILDSIGNQRLNAEAAVSKAMDAYEARLLDVDDEYIKERATDFGEVRRRLLDVLGHTKPALQCSEEHCQAGRHRIVVAEELTPSLTVDLETEQVLGFVTERGGVNSHGAILARAMGVPAVSGIVGIRDRIGCGAEILVNGTTGDVVLWPTESTVRQVSEAEDGTLRMPEPVEPVPGYKVMANISVASEVDEAVRMKAEGIGLYRTEIELMLADSAVDEDTLYKLYASVLRAMEGRTVTYRLPDAGSDKPLPFLHLPKEENPALGLRGTRLLLSQRNLLEPQVRALARLSREAPVSILYPMIVDLDQLLEIRKMFDQLAAAVPHGDIRHGVMFEVPSACHQAREILEVVDFGSIGTNDLIQYFFAVDRNNERVAYDYHPNRGIFWDLLRSLAKAANDTGRPLSVCGEIGGDPALVPKLMELGIECVSASARHIPSVRAAARRLVGK